MEIAKKNNAQVYEHSCLTLSGRPANQIISGVAKYDYEN